jgi:hypothetical protein
VSKIIRFNTNVSNGNRIFFKVYPFAGFHKYCYSSHCPYISARGCWIEEGGEKLSPDGFE